MKNATLKLCVALALALTTFVGPTVCFADDQQTTVAVEESIIEETETDTLIIDPYAPDYDMWSIPVEMRRDGNFGPGFERKPINTEPVQEEVIEQVAEVVDPAPETTVTVAQTIPEPIKESEVVVSEPVKGTEELPVVEVKQNTRAILTSAIEEEPAVEAVSATKSNRWDISLSQSEKVILARIVKLECGGESDYGQQAVVEVIFNRVHSGEWGNGVIGVLSKRGQFTTWKNRNSGRATPTPKEYRNIEKVLNGETNIFPYKTVYFSRGAQNKRVQARIGGHVFCNK